MSKQTQITDLQNLLYVWLSKFEKRSLANIKLHCDFLNESYKLNLYYPIWNIFWPLVYNGIVEHIGKGYYTLTAPIIIDYNTHFVYINYMPNCVITKQLTTGIFWADKLENPREFTVIKINPLSCLKRFPTIKDIVDSFPKSLCEEKALKYYNRNTRRGIAKLESGGLTRYFSIPEECYMRELPNRITNPEAFAIAYCYSRSINKESNGIYNEESKTLSLPTFAFPYLLYRALLLHSLSFGVMPEINGGNYYFKNIPNSYIKQLNRILCNSIDYE